MPGTRDCAVPAARFRTAPESWPKLTVERTMRILLVVALTTAALAAQVSTEPAVLRERLQDKLASTFLRRARWHTDLATAQQAAARSGKLIFCHFTRSFMPCGTSIRCEREVLSTPEFQEFARNVELYCHVTSHVDAAADRLLFATGGSGWPHHALLDATGRIVARHDGEKSVSSFATMLAAAAAYLDIERETAQRIAAAEQRRFAAGMAIGALTLAQARDLFAAMGELTPDRLTRYAAMLDDLEIRTVAARFDRFDEGSHQGAGRHFYGMWQAGKLPWSRDTRRDYWGGLLAYLETRDDPNLELYQQGLTALAQEFGDAVGYRTFLAAKRQALEALRSKSASTTPMIR